MTSPDKKSELLAEFKETFVFGSLYELFE
jgi:hypothetical protein